MNIKIRETTPNSIQGEVRSRTTDEVWRLSFNKRLYRFTCECPGFVFNHICEHIYEFKKILRKRGDL